MLKQITWISGKVKINLEKSRFILQSGNIDVLFLLEICILIYVPTYLGSVYTFIL